MPFIFRSFAAGLFSLALLAQSPAHSQVDEAGAEKLRAQIDAYFGAATIVMGPAAATGGGFGADSMEVVPDGDHYRVVYDNIRMDAGAGGVFSYGSQTLSFAPLGDDRYRVTDIETDSDWTFTDANGELLWGISFTNLTMNAVISGRHLSTEEGGLRADEAEIFLPADPGGSIIVSNPAVAVEEFAEEGGVVSMTQVFTGDSLVILTDTLTEPREIGSAGALRIESAIGGFDIAGLKTLIAQSGVKGITPIDFYGFYEGEMGMTASIENVSGQFPEGAFSVAHADISGSLLFTENPTSGGSYQIGFSGLEIISPSLAAKGVDQRLLPRSLRLALAVDRVPTAPIVETYNKLLSNVATVKPSEDGTEPELDPAVERELELAMERMFADLMASEARLIIKDLSLATQDSSLQAEGEAVVDPQSLYGATAALTAELLGAQALQAVAQEMAASGDPQKIETAQGLLAGLGMMMAFSQGPETPAPSVAEALSYLVRLLPDGSVTVNGIPVVPPPGQQQ